MQKKKVWLLKTNIFLLENIYDRKFFPEMKQQKVFNPLHIRIFTDILENSTT